jgi:dTDP-glucose pyrophosphorylase
VLLHAWVRVQVLVEAVKYAPMAIVQVDDLTDGPACTVLLAREHIARDIDSLLVANSDQWIDWGPHKTVDDYLACAADGCISTFWANDTKWSFARVDETTGLVTEVAEKRVISNAATTGLYFWKSSAAFVKCALYGPTAAAPSRLRSVQASRERGQAIAGHGIA